jgi:hypothetical protein
MSIKSKILNISEEFDDLISIENQTDEQKAILDKLVREFALCISEYSPTRRNLARAFNYLVPGHESSTINQIIELLNSCDVMSNKWLAVINDFMNDCADKGLPEKYSQKSKSDEKQYPEPNFRKISDNIKPNRKMALCKLGCNLEEWLES